MGLFSRLFSGGADEVYDHELEEELDLTERPELYEGANVSVVRASGETLLAGKITELEESQLAIGRLPGKLSFETCQQGASVELRGYSRNMTPYCFKAVVQESSRIICRLKNLKPVPIPEYRNSFRLNLSTPVSFYYQSDEQYQNPEPCTLIDISTGGACVESEFLHAEGEVLNLRMRLEDYQEMTYLGEIIRVNEVKPGVFQYGFLFAQLSEEEITTLTKTLYNIQTGNRRVWSRTEKGSWG